MTVPRFTTAGRFDPAALFQPKSIILLGAESRIGSQILGNLDDFTGPVNTRVTEGASLAILALPSEQIGAAMTGLAAAGCFVAIVPGPATGLPSHVARTGVRVLGAESFGIAVPRLRLNATLSHIQPQPGRLALISQSAAFSRTVIDWAGPNGVGFSHIVGLGSNADLGFASALDWLSRDAGTGAILLDIHHVKKRRLFLSAARAAAKLRPVVAICPGLRLLDETGAAELSFEAALRRVGVLLVKRLEDLLAAAETLSRAKPARCDTLAIVTNGLGPGRLAADSVLRAGLRLRCDEAITKVTSAELAGVAFGLAASPGVGGVLVVHAPDGAADEAAIATLGHPPAGLRVPVLICAMGETSGALHRGSLARAGLPVFATPEQAVRGFEHLVHDRRNREAARELPSSKILTLAPESEWVRRQFGRARAAGRLCFTQDEALAILSAYGIPVVPTRFAMGPADAAVAADLLGYPAVLKLRDSGAPADRFPGCLVLDLHDAAQITAAARLLVARASRRGATDELLVQRQAGRARELSIRVSDDDFFGPAIAIGSGGSAADPAEVSIDLPPLNLALAGSLIRRSRIGRLLAKPSRDMPRADLAAVAQALVRISQLIVDFPEISTLELPSLFADSAGVIAADAWLRLRDTDAAPARLAIAPYPSELIGHFMVGAERLTIRPIRPEDAEAHTAFFARLSPQDIRYRFFSAMRELAPDQTVRLTQVDYDREMAFVAVREATGETVGVSRLACHPDGRSGEFAVIVQADMKGHGLASHLMRRLIGWARSRGLSEVEGQILADNAPMLAFIRHLGFTVRRTPEDPEVMAARLEL